MKEEKSVNYILCPRCELNYILESDEYCDVCKAELGLGGIDIILEDENAEEKLCPICHTNYIAEDEDMCFMCKQEKERKEKADKEEDDWDYKQDVGNDLEDDSPISWEGMGEDEDEEHEEESEDEFDKDFDKDFENFDFDANDVEDNEEDDDDEDEEDEEVDDEEDK